MTPTHLRFDATAQYKFSLDYILLSWHYHLDTMSSQYTAHPPLSSSVVAGWQRYSIKYLVKLYVCD